MFAVAEPLSPLPATIEKVPVYPLTKSFSVMFVPEMLYEYCVPGVTLSVFNVRITVSPSLIVVLFAERTQVGFKLISVIDTFCVNVPLLFVGNPVKEIVNVSAPSVNASAETLTVIVFVTST